MSQIVSVDVPLNHQQLEVLNTFVGPDGEAPDLPSLILEALDTASPVSTEKTPGDVPQVATREVIATYLIQPGQGQAIVVKKGQILRIEQTEGGQCGDFNVFNLHNRHERLHVGRTRIIHGNSPSTGSILWSNAPWERPLMAVLNHTAQTDTLYAGCSSLLYSLAFKTCHHTNCQEILTEAQREYGLNACDVHDSFNLFMYVDADETGATSIVRNRSRKGDYIEFVALMDVLAVSNVCGDDLGQSSNFWLRPLKAEVLHASEEDAKEAQDILSTVEADVLPPRYSIAETPIHKDESYVPSYPHLPIRIETIRVELNAQRQEQFTRVRNRSLYGSDDGAAMRDVMMTWLSKRMDW